MGKKTELLQVRIPSDIMELLDRQVQLSGRTRAGWLRELLERECDRVAPMYEIVNSESMEAVQNGRAEVLQHEIGPRRPIEIAIEGDERPDQGWNMEPHKHLISVNGTYYKIQWTMFDRTSKRLIVRLNTTGDYEECDSQ